MCTTVLDEMNKFGIVIFCGDIEDYLCAMGGGGGLGLWWRQGVADCVA